jgi:sugar phosphate permease
VATRLLALGGWRASFLGPAAWTGAVGVLVWMMLRERQAPATESRVSSREVLRMPMLWMLGAAYFCLKLIRYSLLFWLPFFLNKELGYDPSTAGYLSISFEAGGTLGAIAIGWLSDRLPRGLVLIGMVLGLAASLVIYSRVAAMGVGVNFAAMAAVGFLLYGPDALVCSVAAQDLGGSAAAGTAAGVINGVGSVGAIAQGLLTAHIAEHYGWNTLFRAFMWMALGCALLLVPYARRRHR